MGNWVGRPKGKDIFALVLFITSTNSYKVFNHPTKMCIKYMLFWCFGANAAH